MLLINELKDCPAPLADWPGGRRERGGTKKGEFSPLCGSAVIIWGILMGASQNGGGAAGVLFGPSAGSLTGPTDWEGYFADIIFYALSIHCDTHTDRRLRRFE